eukprot:CAMPEP_0194432698 /NCGR_PEP_ID=MMETSP0176-20130528/72174_1 /TAXON_ID=216777 /ORGANISM="Proboscia alata, Strain PI-D3" /LENGTH=849 /DNA_ID=CAMNT_0039249223 /DNA_START=118 /DNA_END=2667 /DNA_ORIENTATION=+
MLSMWVIVVVKQYNGVFFAVDFPGCKEYFEEAKEHFGDGNCYGGPLNSIGCEFEGGDCIDFNLGFPLCRGDDLQYVQDKVGNDVCDEKFNKYECDFDGGDCCSYEIQRSQWFGDGICNGGKLSTRDCGYDNGDCKTFARNFPDCPLDEIAVNLTKLINFTATADIVFGNGVCDSGWYATETCGFEDADCDVGQIGQDMVYHGVSSGSSLHFNMKMSKDGSKVMAGFPSTNSDGTFDTSAAGFVNMRRYNVMLKIWELLGGYIVGDNAEDHFGMSIAMNGDGTKIAIGSPYNEEDVNIAINLGHVKVFEMLQDSWEPLGHPIIGDVNRGSIGYSIDMTEDGSRLAVASPFFARDDISTENSSVGNKDSGRIQIFELEVSPQKSWKQIGGDILGIGGEKIGYHYVQLNSFDGSKVFFSRGEENDEYLRVYGFKQGNEGWTKFGEDVPNPLPKPPAVSSNGNRVVISSNSTSTSSPGQVQVLDLNEEADGWKEAVTVVASSSMGGFGYSISMNSNGTLLAISSMNPVCVRGITCTTGSVHIYRHESSRFIKVPLLRIDDGYGNTLQESERSDNTIVGYDVSLSGDGSKLSVSGYDFNKKYGFVKSFFVDSLFYPRCVSCPHREVDFSDPNCTKTKYGFEIIGNTTQIIKKTPDGVSPPNGVPGALRIDKNGQGVKLLNVDISPSSMLDCTLVIGLYLERIVPGSLGWVVGNENGGWDRSIVMHDDRLKGMSMTLGYQTPFYDELVTPETKKWIHIVAVFSQGRNSYFYVDGKKANVTRIGQNGPGLPDIYIGQPANYEDHYADCWIKEVKVFDRAFNEEEVEELHASYEAELFRFNTSSAQQLNFREENLHK